MNGKLNKNIGFSLLPFSFIFLFEPFYTFYDILPDFIGYIIVLAAIFNLADLNDRMKDAFRGFRKVAIINFLRFPAALLLKELFADGEKSLGILIITFAFSFAELLAVIPAFKNLFEAMLGLGLTHDGSFVCSEKGKRRRTVTERIYSLTAWFMSIKYIAAVFPEFTTLITNDAYTFVVLLRVLGIIASLAFGIVWLIRIWKYCSKVRKDVRFIDNLSDSYLKFSLENGSLYISRAITSALYLIIIGTVFSIDFYTQYINVLPDVAFYAFVFTSALMLKKHTRSAIPILAACPIGVVVSITSSVVARDFYTDFYPKDVLRNVQAYDRFYTMLGINIVEAVVFLLVVCFVTFMMLAICREHTNVLRGSKPRSRTIISIIPLVIFSITGAFAVSYYIASQPFYNVGKWYFEYAAMIAILFSILFVAVACYYINFIINSVRSNYGIFD